jgi:hypothetical protein
MTDSDVESFLYYLLFNYLGRREDEDEDENENEDGVGVSEAHIASLFPLLLIATFGLARRICSKKGQRISVPIELGS